MNTQRLIAEHVASVPPSGIRRFFDIASEMRDVISLGVGEPDFVTPWNIRESAIYAIEHGKTHYTSNHGLLELRKLICRYLEERFGVGYDPANTMITVGASEALDLAFRAILNPGDEVLIPAPSYVSYLPGVTFAHGVPVPVETFAADNFVLTPENLALALTEKTKAIVVPFPNNPTGAVLTREQADAVMEFARAHDLFVIADEIYAELTYGQAPVSVAYGMEDRTLLISGFSKAFAMTGWRLGYACGPKPVVDAMVKIHQFSMLCAPVMAQIAGIEALKGEMESGFLQVEEMRKSYNRRRLLIYEGFLDMGLPCFEPKGAFYLFPDISQTGLSSEEFCQRLLFAKKIACVPGNAFGERGEGYIRCSYASSIENILEALRRIKAFLSEL